MTPTPEPRSLAERASPPLAIRIPSRGAQWRALTHHDVGAVVQLLHESEAADKSAYRTTHAEIEELFAAQHSAYGGFDPIFGLVAYGYVRVEVEDEQVEAICSGAVHPRWRGRKLGTGIIEWQIDTARHMLSESGHEGEARIVHIADQSISGIDEILTESGFTARESSTLLRRDLAEPILDVELARTLAVEPWTEVWDGAVRRAHAIAYGDVDIHEDVLARFVREWSFVALDRTSDRAKLAGYVVAGRYDEDFAILGFTEARIEAVGVLGNWRGQRVGRALVTEVLRAARASGMDFATLDTDSAHDPSVSALYADTGFLPVTRSTHYVIDL